MLCPGSLCAWLWFGDGGRLVFVCNLIWRVCLVVVVGLLFPLTLRVPSLPILNCLCVCCEYSIFCVGWVVSWCVIVLVVVITAATLVVVLVSCFASF